MLSREWCARGVSSFEKMGILAAAVKKWMQITDVHAGGGAVSTKAVRGWSVPALILN